MTVKLILIRHGETSWTRQKRYCGFADIGLNKLGMEQAQQLSRRLKGEKITRVYASDLKRTYTSAEIACPGKTVTKIAGLREMDFGIFERLTYADIMNKHRDLYQRWLSDPVATTIPEGESMELFAGRVRKALNVVLKKNRGRTILVCSHSGPMRVMICDALRMSLERIWEVKLDPASITIITYSSKGAKVSLCNDTSHLYG